MLEVRRPRSKAIVVSVHWDATIYCNVLPSFDLDFILCVINIKATGLTRESLML